jgi:hypothetical protein
MGKNLFRDGNQPVSCSFGKKLVSFALSGMPGSIFAIHGGNFLIGLPLWNGH